MAGEFKKGPNAVHPETASAVGSRNSLNRDGRDEYAESRLVVDEEVDKIMNHIQSRLPPEVLQDLTVMGNIKSHMHTFYNSSFQNMLNRYLTTAEDELAKKVRDLIDKDENQTLNRYTPREIAALVNQIGGPELFNTGEVEKSVVNIMGHLQGHVQRGTYEFESATNGLLLQHTDVGRFIRGDNAYAVVKCTFRNNYKKPEEVFDIKLAINVLDADGVAATTNPVRFGQAATGLGMAFSGGKQMRFGRLFATSARGSALVPLSMRLELQYWNGTAFVTNTSDTCTTISPNNIEMTNFSQNLDLCETSLTVGSFAKGRATAQLSKPGGANTGSVTLVPRLGSAVIGAQTCIAGSVTAVTGANLPYLQGKWDAVDQGADGLIYDDNPAARGTFGVYPGSGGVIDLRENF